MTIIDCHLHLNEKVDGSAKHAAHELDLQLQEAGVSRALGLHLDSQPWSVEEVAEAIRPYDRLRAFVNVHPGLPNARMLLRNAIEKLGYVGLKLHPRLQGFAIEDEKTTELVGYAGEIGVPVLIDAFPDGMHLMQGFSPLKYAELAKRCPETSLILAHMGGHHVIDFMMLAKRLPNLYFDISYSLLYFQGSRVPDDMVYAMRSMQFARIFYGSDYPDRTVKATLEWCIEFLQKAGVAGDELSRIMGGNARDFLGWSDIG